MNTNTIKSFARKARTLLLDGVKDRLLYWGFSPNGTVTESIETIPGGYLFRGQVFTDTSVPAKWHNLQKHLTSKEAFKDIVEEAAYTWFNRLMVTKILEENGYILPQLRFAEGVRTPLLLQNAKKGQHELKRPYQELLNEYLQEDREEEAFGMLLTQFCHSQSLLDKLFNRVDDYTELLLPQNLLQSDGLLSLINSDAIPREDYHEVELIGWLYQFYISDKKDEVFASFKQNKKARAEDIPAATQIFTPKWIVKYMVENSVGKLYLDYEPDSALKPEMKYLVSNDTDQTSPAIINDLPELNLLDPAAGSGHILVTGFELLFRMYREAGYTARQAVEHILTDNLFGLDIDDRAVQLARFAVLLKAAQYDASILTKDRLPHIYSFPESSFFATNELQNFLGTDGQPYVAELKEALTLLNQGKNVGSALKVKLSSEARAHIEQRYTEWYEKDKKAGLQIFEISLWNRLKPFLDVLLVLSRPYAAVVANPPYMGQKSMNGELKDYVNDNYPLSKADLFAVFMEVCLQLTQANGLMGMINQHSWMFLSSFEKLRDHLLSQYSIASMLHLGTRTFEELSGEVVQSTTFVMEKDNELETATYYRLVDYRSNMEKEKSFLLGNNRYANISQTNFSKIPGSPIVYWIPLKFYDIFTEQLFDNLFEVKSGLSTGDNTLFLKSWFEISNNTFFKESVIYSTEANSFKWVPYNKGGGVRKWYGNNELVVNWADNAEAMRSSGTAVFRNENYYFKKGITWSGMSSTFVSFRLSEEGFVFDSNKGPMIFSFNEKFSPYYLLGYLNNKVVNYILNVINPTVSTQIGDICKIPFIEVLDYKRFKTEGLSDKNIYISKSDWNSRETSWDFQQSPLLTQDSSLRQSYETWQKKATQDFLQLHTNEEELNRIFIDIYGLQEELTPEVALKDITILQEELDFKALETVEAEFRSKGLGAVDENGTLIIPEGFSLPIQKEEVLSQWLSYAIGLVMGRYRLDKPGLNIAHPNPTEEELAAYTHHGLNITIDEDAILPLMGDGANFRDDALLQVTHLLQAIWGEESLTENLNFLQEGLGMSLHKWFTTKFWSYHTRMYKKKPIYWLFTSNPKKPQEAAFRVLVYMHRMDKYTIGKIQRHYLYPHQEYIRHELEQLDERRDTLSKPEEKRYNQLKNWQLECWDYNEVLKELANQELEFDLDDGVDVNYAKFEGAVAKI